MQKGNILDPGAGSGNFAKALREYGYSSFITGIEIENETIRKNAEYDKVIITDYLEWQKDREYQTIFGNPPYSLAREFIEKSYEIKNKNTVIIFLLRLGFLKSKTRFDFWQKHPVNKLIVLSKRPSFTGGGTDASAYGWFIWDGSNKQEIIVI